MRYVIGNDKGFIRMRFFSYAVFIDWNMLFTKGLRIRIYNKDEWLEENHSQ